MSSDHSSEIHWMDWSDAAFERAEREDKLILLSMGASWCHWCHVMDRTTFSNPEVVAMLNERFVPVRVDGDKRPDIQDRYLLGGWPTTAFLLPDGRVLTGTTFIPPEAMLQKLREADALYHDHKPLITAQVTSMAAQAEADRVEAEISQGAFDEGVLEGLDIVLKRSFDHVNGGFGGEPKFPYPDAVRYAFLRHRRTGDPEMLEIALKTLDGMMSIYDPVWGGFYRYAIGGDWTQPHYEKMLYVQAGALDNFCEAYQVTADNRYGEVAAGIKAYIEQSLMDSEKGGFYASQDADMGSHDPSADLILGEAYFPLSDSERREIGIPHVDKTIYTDQNGMMISAYLRLHHVMGDHSARDFALKTADRILAENMHAGAMCHYSDGEPRVIGDLPDQVHFARALVDAYQSSGRKIYLAHAERIAEFLIRELRDVVDGGFYFQPFDPRAKGELLERHKPFDENAAAAELLTKLHCLTGKEVYRDLAARTLNAVAFPQTMESIIGVGLGQALDLFIHQPLRIVVVGNRGRPETMEMVETGLHAYEPAKLVQILDPDEDDLTIGELTYEAAESPAAYVCGADFCRAPIMGSEDLAAVLDDVLSGPPS